MLGETAVKSFVLLSIKHCISWSCQADGRAGCWPGGRAEQRRAWLAVYLNVCAGPLSLLGVKQGLGFLKRYVYLITDDTSPDGAARSQLHILDVKNKLVAGNFSLQGLSTVVVGPGGLAVRAAGGRLFRYSEVELNSQVRRGAH